MRFLLRFVRAAAYWVEDQLEWLLRNPVFPAQILLLLLASWGLLGAELGVEHLFWNESWFVQFGCGLAVGMQFGVVLFVWYLLDRPRRAVVLAARHGRPSLFPSKTNRRVRWLGAYLLWALLLLLTVMILGKAIAIATMASQTDPPFHIREYLNGRHYLLYGIAGYVLSLALAWFLYALDEHWRIRDRIAGWWVFKIQPGFTSGRIPAGEIPLHAVSTYLVCVNLLFLVVAAVVLIVLNETAPGRVVTSPVVLVCLVCIGITQVYGYWSSHVQLGTLAVVAVVLALALWNSASVCPEADYKLRFPGLDDYYATGKRVDLGYLDADGRPPGSGNLPKDRPLLQDKDIITAIGKRWQATPGREQTRPKMILVAVSGGGIRSAVWTTVVLEGLEQQMPGKDGQAAFRDHLRMFTGASGGMLGASLYVADYDHDWPDRGDPAADADDTAIGLGPVSGTLAEQSLLPTLQTAVVRDFSRNLFTPPWTPVSYDRGRSLEEKWALNARARGYGPPGKTASELAALRAAGRRLSPFNRTFADLYALEAQGLRPSLVFSPMLVEDSRRLIVSNLDLGRLAVAVGPVSRKPGESNFRVDGQYSRSGLEFFKLFPEAHDKFEVGTAARMSATFPVVSPAVSLPTIPPRRVVDAGYFDNYGVDLASMWLIQNRLALLENIGGVALVEIRAFPLQDRGLAFHPGGDPDHGEAAGLLADMVAAVSTPLRAVLRARGNSSYHRNNELLAALDHAFNTNVEVNDPYFRRFVFELDTDAALNWYLSTEEKKRIAGRFRDDEDVKNQAKALAEWLGDGSAKQR
jgi:Patatin-like phospholipase